MSERKFYQNAATYWAKVPATIDGVLGGFGHISDIDIAGSKAFLASLENQPSYKLALDCGAGIGRISKNLLIPLFEKVDLVEQDEKFINTAKQLIGEDNEKLGTLYNVGLQNFVPEKKYDVIWCQWVLGHLNDYDFVDFLKRCATALTEKGIIVIKENVIDGHEIEFDEDDSSVTRPYELMKLIFTEAKLKVIKENIQDGFPKELLKVYMFCLVKM